MHAKLRFFTFRTKNYADYFKEIICGGHWIIASGCEKYPAGKLSSSSPLTPAAPLTPPRKNPSVEPFQTPAAAMAIPGCGDGNPRLRRWASPQAAFGTPPQAMENPATKNPRNAFAHRGFLYILPLIRGAWTEAYSASPQMSQASFSFVRVLSPLTVVPLMMGRLSASI